ncbi:hypothetical protein ACQKIC_05945 [Peribacillus sp. NPDC046944]|uniref:hypothetical protein n=1 Tax=unclassified Peribacillus TaxID=2675266 RepID=UPI003D0591C9
MPEIIVLDTNLLYDFIDLKEKGKCNTEQLNATEFLRFMESKEISKGFHVASLYELFGRIYRQEFSSEPSKADYRTKRRFVNFKKNILEEKEFNIKFLNDSYFKNEMNSKLDEIQYRSQNMDKKKEFEKHELTRVMIFLTAYYSFYYLDKNDIVELQNFNKFIEIIEKNLTTGISELIDQFYLGVIPKKKLPKKLSFILGAQIDYVDYVFNEGHVYLSDDLDTSLFKITNYVFKIEEDGIKKIQSTLGQGVPKPAADKKIYLFLNSLKSGILKKDKKGFNSLEMAYYQYLFESIQSDGRKIDKNDAIDFVISTSFETGTIIKKAYGYQSSYNATFVSYDKFLRGFIKKRGKYNEDIHKLIFQ